MGKEENKYPESDIHQDYIEYKYIDRKYAENNSCCSCGRPVTSTTGYSTPPIYRKSEEYIIRWGDPSGSKCCFDCWVNLPDKAKEYLKKQARFNIIELNRTRYEKAIYEGIKHGSCFASYAHYSEDKELFPFAIGHHGHCGICENPIKERNLVDITIYYEKVPVTQDAVLTGGKIRICRYCNSKLNNLALKIDGKFNLNRIGLTKDNCSRCNEAYTLTQDEKKYRQNLLLGAKFLCPACTIIELNSGIKRVESTCLGPPDRFVYYTCKCCGIVTVLDRTISNEYINSKLSLGYEDYRCFKCTLLEAMRGESVIDLEDDFYAVIYKHPENNGNNYAIVYRMANKEMHEIGDVEQTEDVWQLAKDLILIKEQWNNFS